MRRCWALALSLAGALAGVPAAAPATARATARVLLRPAKEIAVAPSGSVAALGKLDVNLDGHVDLVASNPQRGTVSVLLGDGRGGFSLAPGSPLATGGAAPIALMSTGGLFGSQNPAPELPRPVGGTGAILVANTGSGSLALLAGDGTGRFGLAPGSPFPSDGAAPSAVGALEHHGFETQGVVVADAATGALSVRDARPSGFGPPAPGSPFSTGLTPGPVAIATFTHGSGPAVAVVDSSRASTANIAVLLSTPQGGLASAPGSPLATGGAGPVAVITGDFNDDGRTDLAVANRDSNTVSVLLGNRDGSLRMAPGSPFPSHGLSPVALATADLNGDGRGDLAVLNRDSNSLAVFTGDGRGRFTLAPGFPASHVGFAPDALVSSDLNADGRPDLIAGNAGSPDISVLLNATPPARFPSLGEPRVNPNGTISVRLLAPTAGAFAVTVTASGRFLYGCGSGQARGRGPVGITVVPTNRALKRFLGGAPLTLGATTTFIRADATVQTRGVGADIPGLIGRRVRRHRRGRRVVVHVSASRQQPRRPPRRGTARATCPLPASPL